MADKDWTQRLRNRMADQQATVPPDLWKGIEQALDRHDCERRRARVVMLRRWAAAAVTALMVCGAGVVYMQHRGAADPVAATSGRVAGTQTLGSGASEVAEITSDDAKDDLYDSERAPLACVNATFTTRKRALYGHSSQLSDNETATVVPSEDSADVRELPELEITGEPTQISRYLLNCFPSRQERRRKGSAGRVSASLTTSNVLMASATQSQSTAPAFVSSASDGMLMSMPNDANMETQPAFAASEMTGKADHKMPVSVGVTVKYNITDRLSVETGVAYTWLNSDFTRGTGRSAATEEQSLQYIGVPLNVQYRVWQWKGLSAYVSAGGQMDKNIKATRTSDDGKEKVGKDRLQWSAGAAAGVQYDITNQVGVYVEPGMRYYFNNGSQVENIYKDHPWNFNLQLGVRFNIK